MAQNRKSDHDPPHNSDSEEEEENEGEGSSEEQEESESEEQQQPKPSAPTPLVTKKPSAPKKPEQPSQTPSKLQSSSSSSSSESESESESDIPPEKSRKADPNIKPIASKPMDESSKPTKKPRSKPSLPPSSPTSAKPAKRPAGSVVKESKRAKQKVDSNNGDSEKKISSVTQDDSKKQLFQRLWSEDDEIVIVKGVIEYMAKKGADPVADMIAFHEFIRKSLHVDVTKTQLSDKVRRLRKKYENNASKEEEGKERNFAKPHEQKLYELSKKIWGGEGNSVAIENSSKINGTARRNQSQRGKASMATPKVEEKKVNDTLLSDGQKNVEKMEVEHNEAPLWSLLSCRGIGDRALEEEIVNSGLELIKGPKKVELEERWKKLHVESVELYLKRAELICEQTKMVLEALKSGH
ncbi:unnamed protein product [Ilex paraguariensis]|uniref:Glabrous enhancer-binding protein-like DBD domain-containing protein n=1 Tax=Ilex paraguariensis TaxID=185542 RepID=A0ABC8QRV3_9AQUA